MKVILQRDVAKIGRRFDVVDVPDGYALNRLIPQGAAEPATMENKKRVAARKNRAAAQHEATDAAFAESCKRLAGKKVTLTAPANEKGSLFKGISADDVASELNAQGYPVSVSAVMLDAPIKEIGEHELTLLRGDQKAVFVLMVEAA